MIATLVVTYWQHLLALSIGFILAQLFSAKSKHGADITRGKSSSGGNGSSGLVREDDIQCEPPTTQRSSPREKRGSNTTTDPPLEGEQKSDDDAFDFEEGDHIPYPHRDVRYSEEVMVRRSKEFYEEMNKRRSVRFFSDRPVPMEVMENIIRTAGRGFVKLL